LAAACKLVIDSVDIWFRQGLSSIDELVFPSHAGDIVADNMLGASAAGERAAAAAALAVEREQAATQAQISSVHHAMEQVGSNWRC
jgi:hypothetical protein